MEARAIAKYIRISPRKLKPIADMIRGKNANEAIAILKFTPRRGAKVFIKVIESAMANAENNHNMDRDSLYIAEVYANQGPTMKRWKAGSMGRANPILRRTSHVGVVLREKE
ncbi:large subunit ribosomal protein L22 [Caminicella sporogenes DSM 14501]|uniref:Large ribosomal subunit protein uL22 n=1 Tax=Caminicella sporogenes DSM 14501 TaxID=1121266 RepID=A0A1M6TBC5_9FIRM|nr:50S ribosomal protein L22 [Caminicella sporogenes]RKD25435.1 50S ribosomal protein L22 [Caminicella sporogenes]WIF95588.1 50S ribosomal protein L22 [Caminicella sporogenes]SHK54179.1 large subunit ribosomal protein L22 [Caminicella sporogenes DSM 14501]